MADLFDCVGGIQTFNRALVHSLDDICGKNKWMVEVLVLLDGGRDSRLHVYCPSGFIHYHAYSGNRLRFIIDVLRMGYGADYIIIGHASFLALALILHAKSKILVAHGIDAWARFDLAREWGARRLDLILSVSDFTASRLRQANSSLPAPIRLFPCTLDPFYGLNMGTVIPRAELGLPDGCMILCVSRLNSQERYKNIDLLIQAVAQLRNKRPNAFLVVVGDGDDRRRLQREAEHFNAQDIIYFMGRANEKTLFDYYRTCDIFALPSTGEGFGIVYLEAMWHSKPCIGAAAGGVPEVVENDVTGCIAVQDHLESLISAIDKLVGDEDLRARMGQAGRNRLEHLYSYVGFVKRLENILVEI